MFLYYYLFAAVIFTTHSLNFKNNACTSLHSYPFWFLSENCYYNPNIDLDPPETIRGFGFESEQYEVMTKDRYILTLFRIPSNTSGQPVLLQHGFLTDSKIFCSANDSLGIFLARLGYDVWLANLRGTEYSRKHMDYDFQDPRYWDWSLDEYAQYDLDANIKFVADTTKKIGSIIYIGYSMGTTLSFMHFSENPDSQKLVKAAILLSPVAHLYVKHLGFMKAIDTKALQKLCSFLNIRSLFNQDRFYRSMLFITLKLMPSVHQLAIKIAFGKISKKFHYDYLPLFYHSAPQGISIHEFLHYHQIFKTKRFAKYDWNKQKNLVLYGEETPPTYDLGKIKIPQYLLWGNSDAMGTLNDSKRVLKELGSMQKYLIHIPTHRNADPFNHLDFIGGRNMEHLYKPLKNILSKLEES